MDVRLISSDGVAQHSVDELGALLARKDALIWVDIPDCDADATRVLSDVFGFHPKAVHECVERNRVPKVHAYPDHVFVVLHSPQRGERGHVHYVELDQFIGDNFVVTVHGPLNPAVSPEVAQRETNAVLARIQDGRLRPATPFELSYAIVTAISHTQEEYVEEATSEVWELEQRVTGGVIENPEAFLEDLFRARHGLLAVRTMGALSAAIYGRMASLDRIPSNGHKLIADMADQFERVRAVADGEREYLQGVIEFYQTTLVHKSALAAQAQSEHVQRLTEASYAQNEQVKKLSAWAAIFFAPTLIGTVYGMNFDHMPELHWSFGYPGAIGLMVLSSLVLFIIFRRRSWI